MNTHSPPSTPRPGNATTTSQASGATPPRSAGARAGSSAASSAKSAGKSALHKASPGQSGEMSPSMAVAPSQAAKSAPAVTPTSAPKAPAALRHLTNKDGALERLIQARSHLRGATLKAEAAAPAHTPHDLAAKRGGSSTQNASLGHATAAGGGQSAHGHAPVQTQIGDHKTRQAATQPVSSVPQSGDMTFIQRMLAHGLSHQASAAGHPKSQHPLAGPGVTGIKG